ncbi:MAG: efflux RND transporter periplasmic adaptor subunit [Calditrichaeota bacterium]|nr:MAG: efflux RND transporter periplasmic adaptor subunit [Calditrichota bacterium]
MRKPASINLWIVASLFIFIVGCDESDDRSAADLTIPVSAMKVTKQQIASSISATGTLKAKFEQNLLAEVDGILHFSPAILQKYKNGVRVNEGEIIATLENPEHLLTTRVESKKMAMEDAEGELAKQKALFNEGGVTEKELNLAKRAALDARLNYDSALLSQNKLQLRAPKTGFIANLQSIYINTRIKPGFKVCTITDYAECIVEVNLPNSDLGRIAGGARVEISNYSMEDEIFSGRIVSIDPTISPQTRTFTVLIEVDNPDRLLRPGMFVKADLIVEEKQDALVVPKYAVLTRNNQQRVFIVNGIVASRLEVTTGIETRDLIEITEGLSEGDRLIVKGHETLRDKSKVRVIE